MGVTALPFYPERMEAQMDEQPSQLEWLDPGETNIIPPEHLQRLYVMVALQANAVLIDQASNTGTLTYKILYRWQDRDYVISETDSLEWHYRIKSQVSRYVEWLKTSPTATEMLFNEVFN
jgi:hypothetical protein